MFNAFVYEINRYMFLENFYIAQNSRTDHKEKKTMLVVKNIRFLNG